MYSSTLLPRSSSPPELLLHGSTSYGGGVGGSASSTTYGHHQPLTTSLLGTGGIGSGSGSNYLSTGLGGSSSLPYRSSALYDGTYLPPPATSTLTNMNLSATQHHHHHLHHSHQHHQPGTASTYHQPHHSPAHHLHHHRFAGGSSGIGAGAASGAIGGIGTYGSLLGGTVSPPRRRYSIGGLPSASISEYLNLMQSANESAHISNLLNETSRSITRSSQILGVSATGSGAPGTIGGPTAGVGENLSGSALLLASADPTTAAVASASGTLLPSAATAAVDQLLTAAAAQSSLPTLPNFSSHPNIYTQQSLYDPIATSPLLDPLHHQQHHHHHLQPSTLPAQTFWSLNQKKPFSNFLLSRPIQTMPTTTAYGPASASSLFGGCGGGGVGTHCSSYPLGQHHLGASASLPYGSSTLPGPYHRSLSHSRQTLFVPPHYTSNPALSGGSGCLAGGDMAFNPTAGLLHYGGAAGAGGLCGGGVGVGDGGGYGSGGGYANQHFDHHYYQDPLSKLDLDYARQVGGEQAKRQVSFKFDVDTLSVDS